MWLGAVRAFGRKVRKIDSNHCVTHVVRPHEYFGELDRAVWRTLVHDDAYHDPEGWVTLPGPARWWDGYKFKANGWESSEITVTIEARKTALAILRAGKKPRRFEEMSWSAKELMILAVDMAKYF